MNRDQDVVDLLEEQHAQISELFDELLRAGPGSRGESLDALVRLLAVHETAEEELVHPLARRRVGSGEQVVETCLQQEYQIKEMLAALHDGDVDASDFAATVMLLRDKVMAHAALEELKEFPGLRAAVAPGYLRRLAGMLRAAEAMAPTRPHPTVESATGNLLVGPPFAVFDRIRQLLRGLGETSAPEDRSDPDGAAQP